MDQKPSFSINRKFMPGLDLQNFRAKRDAGFVQLRKGARLEHAQAKRTLENLRQVSGPGKEDVGEMTAARWRQERAAPEPPGYSLTAGLRFRHMLSILQEGSATSEVLLSVLSLLRSYMTSYTDYLNKPEMQITIDHETLLEAVLPYLRKYTGEIQREAAAIVNGLFSSELENCLFRKALDTLLSVISTDCKEVAEFAIHAIGEVAADSVSLRDEILEAGALQLICKLVTQSDALTITLTRICASTLGRLLHGSPSPALSIFTSTLPSLQILSVIDDLGTKTEVLSAIANYSSWDSIVVSEIDRIGVTEFALFCITEECSPIATPALTIIGSIIQHDENVTNKMLQMGLLDALERWTGDSYWKVRKEVMWMLSNLAAGPDTHLAQLVAHPIFLKGIDRLSDTQSCVRCEAVWLCRHVALYGDNTHRAKLRSLDIVNRVKKNLYDESETCLNALTIMKTTYETASDEEQQHIAQSLQGDRVFVYIEKLMNHKKEEVAKTAEGLYNLLVHQSTMEESTPEQFVFS